MSSSDLIRWGGLAGMLAGVAFIVLFLVGLVIPEPLPGSFSDILTSIVFIVALLLLLVGLTGFHALQKGSYGHIGRAGLYTVIVATLVQILAQVALISGNTALEFLDFLGLLGVMVGFVLYGAATLKRGYYRAGVVWGSSPACRFGWPYRRSWENMGAYLGGYCSGSCGWRWGIHSGRGAAQRSSGPRA